jgi:hypothetical protein
MLRDLAGRLFRRPGGRFALFHLLNSSLTFVLAFGQLFVFVRVLEPGFYATVVLVTSISIYLVPFDGALAKVAFVELRAEFLNHKTAHASGVVYRLYAAWLGLLLVGVLALVVAAWLAGAPALARVDLVLYLLFCLLSNFWHFEVQTLGWALDQGMAYEKAELVRRSAYALLLVLLFLTGAFAVFAAAMVALCVGSMLWYARILARAGAPVGAARGWRWSALGDALRRTRRNLGGATAGSTADFMLMNGPYAIVTAVYGAGAPLIALDTCQKLLRAIVTVLRICSEALLPKQSTALNDGDYGRLVRVVAAIVVMSGVPALALCAALAFTGDRLFALLLGPLAPMLPPDTGAVLVPLIGAALAQSLASSFLAYSGFFAEVLKAAKLSTALMLGLAAATALGGIEFPTFLKAYAAVFSAAGAASCCLAWLRLRRLRPPVVRVAAR